MVTYKQLSKDIGKEVKDIRNASYLLNVSRKLIKGIVHISKEDAENIRVYFLPKPKKENNKVKLRVMEKYLESFNYRYVSKICGISRKTVKIIVEEWEETGCIIVESSINSVIKIQNRGLFKKGKKWGYNFTNKGVRYYKNGFEDEFSAVEAMVILKEKIKKFAQ